MANAGTSAVRIIDSDNEVASVTSNRLDVNAYLAATPTIDIGDVSLLLGGTAASTNAGAMDAQTLRITLATDDTHFGEVGAAQDADGTIHAQLLHIANNLASIDGDTGFIKTATQSSEVYASYVFKTFGTSTYTETSTYGNAVAAVRNDTLAALAGTDNEFAPLQVNADGALYVDVAGGGVLESAVDGLETNTGNIDTSTTDIPNVIGTSGSTGPTKCISMGATEAGGNISELTINSGALKIAGIVDLGSTDNAVLDAIAASLALLDNSIASGNELQVDVVAALPAGTNAIGKLAANSGVDIGDVDVTSMPSDTFVAEGGSLGKGVLMQADDGTDRQNLQMTGTGFLKTHLQSVSYGVSASNPFKADKNAYTEADIGISAKAKRSDVLANLTNIADDDWTSLQVCDTGALYTTHGMTGMQSDNNEGVDDSTAEVLKSSTACKRVDMQADSANTGYIYVGGSDVSATKGIRLAPGDFYSIDVNNTADIYVLASVDEEDIHFTYFT